MFFASHILKRRTIQRVVVIFVLFTQWSSLMLFAPPKASADDFEERFADYEIRVIRPRFFQKSGRFELGAGVSAIMNNAFVYTFMASGLLSYHFSETFGFETAAGIGYSIDRKEKEVLHDDYNIKTEVFRTKYALEGALLWTPVYGKVQLPEGRLVYFDTFLALGGGMTGVEWQYKDMCVTQDTTLNPNAKEPPADKTQSYPNIVFGIGQRIFRSRKAALRWDLRDHTIFYKTGDASCDPDAAGKGSNVRHNITLQIGGSQFF